jgi:RNA polymerase sigma factor (TIGR02999 family)
MVLGKSQSVTQLLTQWSEGNDFALEELMPLVYDELRVMAKRHMGLQKKGHTFQTTELIHEAYVKLAKNDGQSWDNRAHFFSVASKAMRHILVDYARSKNAQKRGNAAQKITFEENAMISKDNSMEVLALDEALKSLQKFDERKSQIVEMKFFGGLTIEEIARVLKISAETVKRDWRFSRTWLLKEISQV